MVRSVTSLAMVAVLGCGVFDFEQEQAFEEVAIEGAVEAHRLGERVAVDAIPPQDWTQELEREPAGIFVERLWFEITADGVDFDFIDKLHVYVEPTLEGSALPRMLLAWSFDPGPVERIDLTVNRALNLVPYIVEGFEVVSVLNAVVPERHTTFQGTAVLSVDLL